jgi:hypothetical protein
LSLYIHNWIYTAKGYTKPEFLDSKPHTKGKTQKKSTKTKKKMKTKIQTSSPSMLQIFNGPPSRSSIGEVDHHDFQSGTSKKDTT